MQKRVSVSGAPSRRGISMALFGATLALIGYDVTGVGALAGPRARRRMPARDPGQPRAVRRIQPGRQQSSPGHRGLRRPAVQHAGHRRDRGQPEPGAPHRRSRQVRGHEPAPRCADPGHVRVLLPDRRGRVRRPLHRRRRPPASADRRGRSARRGRRGGGQRRVSAGVQSQPGLRAGRIRRARRECRRGRRSAIPRRSTASPRPRRSTLGSSRRRSTASRIAPTGTSTAAAAAPTSRSATRSRRSAFGTGSFRS